MSKKDKDAYIVKFVKSKGHEAEYALKAYEVHFFSIRVCVYIFPLWCCFT